ncbi:phosphoribosylglycinamide formyltransferase [Ehrlichia ruminantium]|nr:phosphoribosylglycinamide formyltransferase [Ehrlichia ruminantium]
MKPLRLGILISGRGSNMQALINACQRDDFPASVSCVIAGFMSIVPEKFINKWLYKVINIHPSLLPSFKGLNAQAQALKAGVKIAGCTVHYVYPEVDGGPIIVQAAVPVFSSDSVEDLADRILKMEHICYPKAVELIAYNQLQLNGSLALSAKTLHMFYNDGAFV